MNPNCPRCQGEGWVCEAHPLTPWIDGKNCCGEPGVPCGLCNPEGAMPPGFMKTCSVTDEDLGTARLDAAHQANIEFARKCLRLDELLEKKGLTEQERKEFESLEYLLSDPEYQSHRRSLTGRKPS